MDWTIRKKILLGYGVVLLLLAFVLAWAFINLLRLGSASEEILSENYQSIRAAERMITAVDRQNSGALLSLLGDRDAGRAQFREARETFSQSLGRAKGNVTIEGEARLLRQIDSTYAAYLDRADVLLRSDSVQSGGADRYQRTARPAFRAVRESVVRLRDLNQQTMFDASTRAEEVARWAEWSVGTVGLLALALGFGLSLVLSNRLARPVRRLQAATRRMAEGEYDVEVEARGSDELARLAEQFNEMAAQIRAFREMNVGKIQAEKRKGEAIIQSVDDGLVMIGAGYAVETMNPAAERALGTRREAAQGRHFLESTRDEKLFERVRAAIEPSQQVLPENGADDGSKGGAEPDDFITTGEGAEKRHYQPLATPVRDASGDVLGAILHLRDVTKIKEIDQLKSEFVATASHQLKTPLTSIEMSVGLLRDHVGDRLEARDQQLLEDARQDVGRLRALIEDLLDLSKIESGRMEMDVRPVPVALLFEKAMQNLKSQAAERSVALRCETPTDLPDARADANKVTWVLNNLISNALRYTQQDGDILLSAERAGGAVHLSVADDGAGIPYEHQREIFDKFVQIENGEAVGGSGLGLAICKEIVEALGGRIWVDSVPGEGSIFTFTLPAAS